MEGKKATPTPKSQSQKEKFIAMAKELGSDTSEKAFDAALKRVGKAHIPIKVGKKIAAKA
jgi:hypothetical protein